MKLRMLAIAVATGLSTAVVPMVVAPAASADVCSVPNGRQFVESGCTSVYGEAIASSSVPYVIGEVPCYTLEGVPYFTPPGSPC